LALHGPDGDGAGTDPTETGRGVFRRGGAYSEGAYSDGARGGANDGGAA